MSMLRQGLFFVLKTWKCAQRFLPSQTAGERVRERATGEWKLFDKDLPKMMLHNIGSAAPCEPHSGTCVAVEWLRSANRLTFVAGLLHFLDVAVGGGHGGHYRHLLRAEPERARKTLR
ncbi:hypothetical protein J3458_003568 [Metarhizium acridum]|uniref:uncharacterized protein n=1 Tax=Metarhizium acridum TaxID=92637 RepID=UPI001C6C0044|nr:hypothetical protein J3458_003568 [Metarhizium acridum]